MLRETSSEVASSGKLAPEAADPDDYFKLSAQIRRLLERVALPRRWTREDVREVQKTLKDTLRELDRQTAAAGSELRLTTLRRARSQLSMSPASVPTPAWYLCLLGAWETLAADLSPRRTN